VFKKRPLLVQPASPVRLISLDDPAVDREATGEAAITEFSLSTGMDRSKIVLTGEPTEFGVLPLSPSQWREVKTAAQGASSGRQVRYISGLVAFGHGCQFIEAMEDERGAGGMIERAEWDTYIDPDVQVEIGQYIIKLSKNTEPDAPK
jgi:hypothetical protein